MITIENISKKARLASKPNNVSASAWANAMNWNIEAWKCVLGGQKWIHTFEICCPEQYYMLLDEKGRFILSDVKDLKFADSTSIRKWVKRIESLIIDMREKSEWNESLKWAALVSQIMSDQSATPNEDVFKKGKRVVKGHRLIRIKSAA